MEKTRAQLLAEIAFDKAMKKETGRCPGNAEHQDDGKIEADIRRRFADERICGKGHGQAANQPGNALLPLQGIAVFRDQRQGGVLGGDGG